MTTPLIVATAARKGGVGKTTIAVGCAALSAHSGKRTLIIDLDPQSNVAFALGVDPRASGAADLLLGLHVKPSSATENLLVLPGGPGLNDHTIASLDPEDLADVVQGLPYDLVVIDCPPGSDHLERLGLVAAHIALVVLDAHPFALGGAYRVIDFINQRRSKERRAPAHCALVQSRIDKRRALDRDLEANLLRTHPGLPIHCVRQDIALATATADRRPIQPDPQSRGIQDLENLTRWIHEQR